MSSRATQDPGISTIPWTAEDDRLLRELKTAKVSWRKISMVIDDRPIRDLKRRWDCIRSGKPRYSQVYSFAEDADGFYSTIEQPYAWGTKYQGKERHVSFRTLPTDEADEEENISQPPKIKRVYYIDDAFTLEDVLLLHKIASEWRKDRWTTISTRFNEMTGRHITPDEAKSVIDT
ncbi:hypothetical protein P175DRAFT_0473886 [Aspergillus ochraceoroseus IBT 24754]|uniref:Myb-like domain-containing protein n=1 Tax=Aspergillus ochraceoroseus IBT 24754 TaxID=1392256 RepID=A0A2T5M275_9EURO|nr:uncharacterized protein P175DRAFT_0473886 [Aspergillus ochraceoroseus IBT 24754]PTU22628.1 hypothetical protein P175DRAFT_0473886 [Aspergillus ochraceoroseus IBT 24754]